MALPSSLRFERANKGPSISKAQSMQLERVRQDEIIAAQEQLIKNDMKATLRAEWNESLEETSDRKRLKAKTEEIKRELKLANKAVIEVRKHQLRQLLESEYEQQEAELHNLGLTFHKDRL